MSIADVQALTAQVLWAVFALSLAFGALVQRTHFCTMGAVADIINLGDWSRMRMWALAAGVMVLGFNLMVALGWVQAEQTLYGGPRWLWASALVGGVMFGFGMVLGSGCGSKTLVRIGGGNLKSLVVLIVMGVTAWATLRGMLAVLRVQTLDKIVLQLPVSQDLPSLLSHATGGSVSPTLCAFGCAVLLGGGLIAWALSRVEGRHPEVLLGGLGVGLLGVLLWWVSGRLGFVPEHPDTLEPTFLGTASQRMEAFAFTAPVAQLLEWWVFYSDSSRHLSFGVVAVLGVALGSAVVAVTSGQFRWEGFRDTADTARHLIGAVLMGAGGVTAMGCSIGQGLSGLSTLGLNSLVAVPAIIAGAALGMHFLTWQLERQYA